MHVAMKVIGPDVTYKDRKTSMYIDGSKVIAAYPSYAIRAADGSLCRCVPEHKDAELVAYKLKYFDNSFYICSDEEELRKIGVTMDPDAVKRGIGFVLDEIEEKEPDDIG